jgi:hypothetical protein
VRAGSAADFQLDRGKGWLGLDVDQPNEATMTL